MAASEAVGAIHLPTEVGPPTGHREGEGRVAADAGEGNCAADKSVLVILYGKRRNGMRTRA